MSDQHDKAGNEADKQAPKPEALADEQLDDAAGGLLTWGNGESLGGGDSPVVKPKRK